jgi:elongation factor Ts
MITTDQIKALREQTGVSVMQCKKALEEAGGDMEKALAILKEKSKEIAGKKSDRVLGAGHIATYVHSTGTIGAMVELVSETDFVSKNEEFKTLAKDIAVHVVASHVKYLRTSDVPAGMEEIEKTEGTILLDQPFFKNPDVTIQGLIEGAIQKFGEKIDIARFAKFSVLEN